MTHSVKEPFFYDSIGLSYRLRTLRSIIIIPVLSVPTFIFAKRFKRLHMNIMFKPSCYRSFLKMVLKNTHGIHVALNLDPERHFDFHREHFYVYLHYVAAFTFPLCHQSNHAYLEIKEETQNKYHVHVYYFDK